MPAGSSGGPARWTAADQERYGRDGLRYPSDLTDAEWALIAALIRPAKRGGRRRSVVVREGVNGGDILERRGGVKLEHGATAAGRAGTGLPGGRYLGLPGGRYLRFARWSSRWPR